MGEVCVFEPWGLGRQGFSNLDRSSEWSLVGGHSQKDPDHAIYDGFLRPCQCVAVLYSQRLGFSVYQPDLYSIVH